MEYFSGSWNIFLIRELLFGLWNNVLVRDSGADPSHYRLCCRLRLVAYVLLSEWKLTEFAPRVILRMEAYRAVSTSLYSLS